MRYFYVHLHKNSDSTNERGYFLETYNLLMLNHEEIKHLNRLMMSEEIEAVIKIYQYRKV